MKTKSADSSPIRTGRYAPDLPVSMRAAVMYDVDDIRIEERALPRLEQGDALLRTGASGVCSGDLMPWYVRRKAPFVFGHEVAGTIVAIDDEAEELHFAVGDRVFVHHHAPCFACSACARGDFVQCATWKATSLDPGGMAAYVRIPRANLADTLALPDAVSFVDGSLVEPLACVCKSLRRGGAAVGQSIYVIGLGVMGLMHVALAHARGMKPYGSDFLPERRERAGALGAVEAFEPDFALERLRSATGEGADLVICGPGSSAALQHAIEAVRPGGTVVMFTPIEPIERFMFDQSTAYFRDARLIASYSCGPDDTREALDFIARGIVSARRLGATLFGPDEISRAYAAMKSTEVLKAIVAFTR
jgi:L-iditol 2-dehydrogenase